MTRFMKIFEAPAVRLAGISVFFYTLLLGKSSLWLLFVFLFLSLAAEWAFHFRHHERSPYPFFLPAPFLLVFFSSAGDFEFRLASLYILVYVVYFAFVDCRPLLVLSTGKKPVPVVWILAFLISALYACIIYSRGIYLSGDEPHYVLMAQSLADDGDIDLKNNMDVETYRSFHPVALDFHGSVHKGRWVPFHMPGLPVLLVPFYKLFRLAPILPAHLFFRLAASFIHAFLGLGIFLILSSLFKGKNILPFWLLVWGTFPLLIHSIHLYPELSASVLMLFAFKWAVLDERYWLAAGLLMAAVPWFHVKYAIPVAILAAWTMFNRIKKREFQSIFVLALPLIISAFSLALYSYLLYESANPNAIFPPADYFSVSHWQRLETLLAFFLDQRDGLLVYSPYVLFMVPGFFGGMKKRWGFLLLFFSYIGFHAFTTVRGAYSPAGRPVMFVYWIAILGLAYFHWGDKKEWSRRFYRLGIGFSWFMLIWITIYPLFVYQPVTAGTRERASALLSFLGSTTLPLNRLFPSFLKTENLNYPADIFWVVLLIAGLSFWLVHRKKAGKTGNGAMASWVTLVVLIGLFCLIPRVHLNPERQHITRDYAFFNNSRNFSHITETGRFRIRAGLDYDIFFDLRRTRCRSLRLEFGNLENVRLRLRSGRRTLFLSGDSGNKLDVRIDSLHTLTAGGRRVAHLGFEVKGRREQYLFVQINSK